MILMLDNYDSFTYNLVQYLKSLGAELRVVRNDELSVKEVMALEPLAFVLSPGPGRPEDSGIMNDLIREAAGEVPILGVCLGHQAIAQVYGGKIGYAPSIMHGKTSRITHEGTPLFEGIESPFEATRYHSLTIEPDTLPAELRVTALTDNGVVMAIEHITMPLYGVQFHPESILTRPGMTILRNFLEGIN